MAKGNAPALTGCAVPTLVAHNLRTVACLCTPSQEKRMDRGIDFLKSQINNAVMQHKTFVENLTDHSTQAEDERFRALCNTFLPKATAHQQMLEDYQREI